MADIIGLITLAALMVVGVAALPGLAAPAIVWLFVYLGLSAASLYFWRTDYAPRTPSEWLYVAVATVAVGAVFLAIDHLLGGSSPHIGVATLAACPGFTCVALAGFARTLYTGRAVDHA